MLQKPSFDAAIDMQVKNIAKTHAKYVAIATPYDDEFLPILKRWVKAARKYKLHVWYRGNFSGWEGWFGYAHITRATHKQKLEQFITQNPDLFQNGDIFTPCPECENGGAGDPRQTGDVSGFRAFMIDEYTLTQQLFTKMHKTVHSNLASMNYDVANLVMDKKTTAAMGGIVTVDHYVSSAEKLALDLDMLAQKTGGKVVLGEFGAPIPDLHGSMTPDEQADWVHLVLSKVTQSYAVVGVNYWVNVGGSTQIWDANGTPSPAVDVITAIFSRYKH
jgi:hypothetical protein